MWNKVSERLPKNNGKYECKIINENREFEAIRLYKNGYWFGGCRPFSDNDEIIMWKEVENEHKN